MNLKNLLFASSFVAATSFAALPAHASIEDALANICNIVKANDKGELRKKMKNVQKSFRLRLGDYYEGIQCNGNSLIRFALISDAVDAGTLLVKKLPKSKLREPEEDGIALTAWIESKGFSDSPIAAEVSEKI